MSTEKLNRLNEDEHILISGMTGCGKTILAEVYGAGFDNVIKIDTKQEYFTRIKKGEPPWRGLIEGEDYAVCHSLDEVIKSDYAKIIYVVPWNEQEEEYYNQLFKYCFEQEDITVWVDEVMSVCPNAHKYPQFLKAILTAGRSRNVRFMGCTQRPVGIPVIIGANVTHFFTFMLNQETDRQRMVDITGSKTLYNMPDKYYFYYYKVGMSDEDVMLATLVLHGE